MENFSATGLCFENCYGIRVTRLGERFFCSIQDKTLPQHKSA
jgi:hypothetical protein